MEAYGEEEDGRGGGAYYSHTTTPVDASINNGPRPPPQVNGMAVEDGPVVTVERGDDDDDDDDAKKKKKKRGVCDVCMKPHMANEDMNLRQCNMCGVCVHELCYGMIVTTGTAAAAMTTMMMMMETENTNNFVCHACKATGLEVEVNVPSRVGGPTLQDLLSDVNGIYSFTLFIRERQKEDDNVNNITDITDSEKKIDFYVAAGSFTHEYRNGNKDDKNVAAEEGGSSSSMKEAARRIYNNYCTKSSHQYITSLSSSAVSDIESNIMFNDETRLTNKVFDNARREVLVALECSLFEEYIKSSQYSAYLSTRRTTMIQNDRPVECALCSVKSKSSHAMHPLYDMPGKDGRQLVLPPDKTGPNFMRKGPRLAWVHTLCAMFISANENYSGLVYGCDGDGNWESIDDDDDDGDDDDNDGDENMKRINSYDDDDEKNETEQDKFTKCEEVYWILMDRLAENIINTASKLPDSILNTAEEDGGTVVRRTTHSFYTKPFLPSSSFVVVVSSSHT